jgi:hypothetical protein
MMHRAVAPGPGYSTAIAMPGSCQGAARSPPPRRAAPSSPAATARCPTHRWTGNRCRQRTGSPGASRACRKARTSPWILRGPRGPGFFGTSPAILPAIEVRLGSRSVWKRHTRRKPPSPTHCRGELERRAAALRERCQNRHAKDASRLNGSALFGISPRRSLIS